jgi:hypothetical protein
MAVLPIAFPRDGAARKNSNSVRGPEARRTQQTSTPNQRSFGLDTLEGFSELTNPETLGCSLSQKHSPEIFVCSVINSEFLAHAILKKQSEHPIPLLDQ